MNQSVVSLLISLSWDRFFGNVAPNIPPKVNQPISENSGSFFVFSTEFHDLSPNGAISFHVSDNQTKLLIEEVSFTKCSSSTDGGSVHFSSSGSCVQSKVCSTLSKANSAYGHHSYVIVSPDSDHLNILEQTTFNSCGEIENGRSPAFLSQGNIQVVSLNSSNNNCAMFSALYIYSSSVESITNYSTFSQNTASAYGCIYFYSGQNRVHHCNIIYNKHSDSYWGMIASQNAQVKIEESCIMKNTVTPLFEQSGEGKITIIKCSCDWSGSTRGSVDTSGCGSNTFINGLVHLSFGTCDSFYDSIGTLQPNLPTRTIIPPTSTPRMILEAKCFEMVNQVRIKSKSHCHFFSTLLTLFLPS